jgi:hypothetical protein
LLVERVGLLDDRADKRDMVVMAVAVVDMDLVVVDRAAGRRGRVVTAVAVADMPASDHYRIVG